MQGLVKSLVELNAKTGTVRREDQHLWLVHSGRVINYIANGRVAETAGANQYGVLTKALIGNRDRTSILPCVLDAQWYLAAAACGGCASAQYVSQQLGVIKFHPPREAIEAIAGSYYPRALEVYEAEQAKIHHAVDKHREEKERLQMYWNKKASEGQQNATQMLQNSLCLCNLAGDAYWWQKMDDVHTTHLFLCFAASFGGPFIDSIVSVSLCF